MRSAAYCGFGGVGTLVPAPAPARVLGAAAAEAARARGIGLGCDSARDGVGAPEPVLARVRTRAVRWGVQRGQGAWGR